MNETKPPRIGLKGFWKERRNNGQRFWYKLRDYRWQLRYALRRAWLGYDDVDIFDLGYAECDRLIVLLTTFQKDHDEFVDDAETGQVALQIANLLYEADEDRIFESQYGDITPDYEQIKAGYALQRAKIAEAFKLFGENACKFWI